MPAISVLGLADLMAAWLDGCGCTTPVTFVGASLGGMVGVAFAVRYPERCGRLIAISAGLRPDGWGTATRHLQRELVRDGLRNGDVATGMSRARQLGMLTYRGRASSTCASAAWCPGLEQPPVAEYLEHHGRRFAETVSGQDVSAAERSDRSRIDRASIARRCARRSNRSPPRRSSSACPATCCFRGRCRSSCIASCRRPARSRRCGRFESEYGHDAFLADQDRLADLLRGAGAFGGELRPLGRPRFDGVGIEPVRELRIGLVGCGTVGRGLLEMIERQRGAVADRYGVHFACRRSRCAI